MSQLAWFREQFRQTPTPPVLEVEPPKRCGARRDSPEHEQCILLGGHPFAHAFWLRVNAGACIHHWGR